MANRGELTIVEGAERIAVIDDEAAIASTIEPMLASFGYKVSAFTDSLNALTTIKSNPNDFDVVITDYSMPKITGLEIARNLKEAGIDLPVIMISGYLAESMEALAREAGISLVLTKPVSLYQLTDAIRKASKEKSPDACPAG